jgi:hypothetical protein
MPATSAGLARAPYESVVEARACNCPTPPKVLGTSRTLERAEALIGGYWSTYVAFFGDQAYWLQFSIVDRRDGVIVWRNGRRTDRGGNSGEERDSRGHARIG